MRRMRELDRRLVLCAGGWDPRYAVTLAVALHDDVGAALIDSNGDGIDVDLDIYERDADGVWRGGDSSGVGDAGASLSTKSAVAWGRAEPSLIIDIDYAGERYSVATEDTGWWLFVTDRATAGVDVFPERVGSRH